MRMFFNGNSLCPSHGWCVGVGGHNGSGLLHCNQLPPRLPPGPSLLSLQCTRSLFSVSAVRVFSGWGQGKGPFLRFHCGCLGGGGGGGTERQGEARSPKTLLRCTSSDSSSGSDWHR